VSAHLGFYVDCTGPEWKGRLPANDAAQLNVVFEDGAQGAIHVSWLAHVGRRSQEQVVVLHGEDGTLEAEMSYLATEIRGVRWGEETFETLAVPDELWGAVDREKPPLVRGLGVFVRQPVGDRLFVDCILEDRPAIPSFYNGLKVQQVMEAAIQSHERGCWVTL
jgi:predicted dehydrogenase